MVAVYADGSPQLEETATHLLELIEVGLGIFQLCLAAADTMASRSASSKCLCHESILVVVQTGFKWAVLAGLHPADTDRPNRVENYMVHVSKYDFSSLTFPVPLSSVASFAVKNNISINVYGAEDGQKVIYPLRVSDVVVPDRHVDLLLNELGEIQHDHQGFQPAGRWKVEQS